MAGRVMLVASTGGHLDELHRLAPTLLAADDLATWVTFDCAQSQSLLAGERDVVFVRRVGTRGYRDLARVLEPAASIVRRVRPSVVYSTGAGIALAFLPAARLVKARAVYVESAARTAAPSFTGRLLARLPGVELRTQHRAWQNARWSYAGSVFDGYRAVPVPQPPAAIRRIVVTLGTQPKYPFVRLVQRLRRIIPADVEVRWQVGPDFPAEHRPAGAYDTVAPEQLRHWVESSDVVVAHAGVGSALTMFRYGRTPVLVPREVAHHEHVDDHQLQICDDLQRRGLAVTASADDLTWDLLVAATRTVVVDGAR